MGVLSGWERSHSWAHVSGRAGGWASGMAAPADRQECPAPDGRLSEAGLRTWKPLSVSASIPHAAIPSVREVVGHGPRPFRPNRATPAVGGMTPIHRMLHRAPGRPAAPPRLPRPGVHACTHRQAIEKRSRCPTDRQELTLGTGVDIHGSSDALWERSHVRCPCPRRHLSDRAPSARHDDIAEPPPGRRRGALMFGRPDSSTPRDAHGRTFVMPARNACPAVLRPVCPGRGTPDGRHPPRTPTVLARSPQEMTDAFP